MDEVELSILCNSLAPTHLEYGAHATSPTCELRSNIKRGFLEKSIARVSICLKSFTASMKTSVVNLYTLALSLLK
jgi:hypothetical protein